MKTMDERTALAVVFANTKRKKRPDDLVTVAQAFQQLRHLYGSQKKVARKVGLSPEMVRQFLKVLALQPEVMELVKSREIDRLDVAYRLAKIGDREKQMAAAAEAADLDSKDVRTLERVLATTQLSARSAAKEVLDAKLKGMHLFVLDFDDQEYQAIREKAAMAGVSPTAFAKRAVLASLSSGRVRRSPRQE